MWQARFLACALLLACATGVTDETGIGSGSSSGGGGAGGESSGETSTQANTSAATTGSGAGGEGGAPPGCNYDPINTCAMATQLPAIAGDESGPIINETGSTSEWFVIHIEEQDGSISESDMSYTVTLQSPTGMDYDLFVHQGPQDGTPDCAASPLTGNQSSPAEAVSGSWDDDQGLGGEDDSLWLSIEVRYVSGSECGTAAQWTLTIQGNT